MTPQTLLTFSLCSLLTLFTTGCADFRALKQDLRYIEAVNKEYQPLHGVIQADKHLNAPVVIVLMQNKEADAVLGYRVVEKPGAFEYRAKVTPSYIFAFSDLNNDLTLQPFEPYGWYQLNLDEFGKPLSSNGIRISLLPAGKNSTPPPELLTRIENTKMSYIAGIEVNMGTISSLDAPIFSPEQAHKGLWSPMAFIWDGAAGIHFMQTYDPTKIPVLYVHGIDDSPLSFKYLIDNLDTDKYQPWVLYYASGFRLGIQSKGLFNFMSTLKTRYGIKDLHIVAHSMGGLLVRGYLNQCSENNNCSYIRSFTSISTPWEGHKSAKMGVDYSPAVIPVWLDMNPSSDYLSNLFNTPLPKNVPHHLLFGIKQQGVIGFESNDGSVALSSVLSYAAQEQAAEVSGFNEGHVSILRNKRVLDKLHSIFNENNTLQ